MLTVDEPGPAGRRSCKLHMVAAQVEDRGRRAEASVEDLGRRTSRKPRNGPELWTSGGEGLRARTGRAGVYALLKLLNWHSQPGRITRPRLRLEWGERRRTDTVGCQWLGRRQWRLRRAGSGGPQPKIPKVPLLRWV